VLGSFEEMKTLLRIMEIHFAVYHAMLAVFLQQTVSMKVPLQTVSTKVPPWNSYAQPSTSNSGTATTAATTHTGTTATTATTTTTGTTIISGITDAATSSTTTTTTTVSMGDDSIEDSATYVGPFHSRMRHQLAPINTNMHSVAVNKSITSSPSLSTTYRDHIEDTIDTAPTTLTTTAASATTSDTTSGSSSSSSTSTSTKRKPNPKKGRSGSNQKSNTRRKKATAKLQKHRFGQPVHHDHQ
jgi:hypothetical protein